MHAEHPQGEGLLLIKGTLTHQGRGDRQTEAFRQLGHLLVGATADGTATHVQQRTAGLANQPKGRRNRAGLGSWRQLEACGNCRPRRNWHVVEFFCAHVLGHID